MTKKSNPFNLALLALLAIPVFIACNSGKAELDETTIDLDNISEVSFFDIFKDTKVVQLETHPEALIGSMSKVVFSEGYYFISDTKTLQIFRFDSKGKYVSKISAKGKGPGEYYWIGDFALDQQKKQILLLDPAAQRIVCYDFMGNHLETLSIKTDRVMGYNNIFVINDSVLLATSINNQQLLFYNRIKKKVEDKFFDIPFPLGISPFLPSSLVYQTQGRTYALRNLTLDVFDVTEIQPKPHFAWNFDRYNNTEEQYKKLVEELEKKIDIGGHKYIHHLVGKGKILHQHIMRVAETPRFRIARLEFNNNYLNVIVDKISNKQHVFKEFKEGISLNSAIMMQENLIITFKRDTKGRLAKANRDELIGRNYNSFSQDILSKECLLIVENHNEVILNPFLVIYKFRE